MSEFSGRPEREDTHIQPITVSVHSDSDLIDLRFHASLSCKKCWSTSMTLVKLVKMTGIGTSAQGPASKTQVCVMIYAPSDIQYG